MKILTLDPSSTAIGYCFGREGSVLDAGVVTPAKKSAPAIQRIESMADQLGELITGSCIQRVVIEMPSKHVNRGRHGGSGAGLAVYGMAVGFVWGRVQSWGLGSNVDLVDPETWTHGRAKAMRILRVQAELPGYDPAKDKGGDCADAVCLMWWWFQEQRLRGVA